MKRRITRVKFGTSIAEVGSLNLTIVDDRTEWQDEKPTRAVVLNLDSPYDAADLLNSVRKILKEHRRRIQYKLQYIDNMLEGK